MKEDWVIILTTSDQNSAKNVQLSLKSEHIESFLLKVRRLRKVFFKVYVPKTKGYLANQLLVNV